MRYERIDDRAVSREKQARSHEVDGKASNLPATEGLNKRKVKR